MRAATALVLVLLLCAPTLAQVPPTPSPIEGPLTEQNTTAAELDVLFALGQLRHEDGSLPHLGDPIFGDDFFAIGADCVNGANVPVWHWHRFDIDGFVECGHGAVIIAEGGGGGGGVPDIFSPGFLSGELVLPSSPFLDPAPGADTTAMEDLDRVLNRMFPFAPDGIKIADNDSPRPKDRVFFIYNYFGDAAGSNTPGGIPTVQQQTFGLEKTFLDSQSSVGLRLPFLPSIAVNPNSGQIVVSITEIGDLGVVQRFLLSSDGGATWDMAVTPPDKTEVHVHSGVAFNRDGQVLNYSAIFDGTQDFELNIRGVSGQTFNDLSVPNGAADHGQRFQPNIAVDPKTGIIAVTWMDVRQGGQSGIGVALNDGQRWGDYSAVASDLPRFSVDPMVAFDHQGRPFVTFSYNGGGDFDPLLFGRLSDGSWRRLPGTGPDGAIADTPGQSRDPHISFDTQGQMYVYWTETENNSAAVYVVKATDVDGDFKFGLPYRAGGVEPFPGGIVPPDTQDFYRFQHPSGGIRFYGIGPDGSFNGSLAVPSPSARATRWGDYEVMEGAGPFAPIPPWGQGDDMVPIGDTEAKRPDDAVYPLQNAFDKMIKKISGGLAGPDQKTLADILRGTYTGTQPKTKDGVTTPGKSLEDAAKDAVEANKDALKKNPDARKVYEGLQGKADKDAQSSDAHDAARGRQWQRVLDAIGKAAGWPTSAELKTR